MKISRIESICFLQKNIYFRHMHEMQNFVYSRISVEKQGNKALIQSSNCLLISIRCRFCDNHNTICIFQFFFGRGLISISEKCLMNSVFQSGGKLFVGPFIHIQNFFAVKITTATIFYRFRVRQFYFNNFCGSSSFFLLFLMSPFAESLRQKSLGLTVPSNADPWF